MAPVKIKTIISIIMLFFTLAACSPLQSLQPTEIIPLETQFPSQEPTNTEEPQKQLVVVNSPEVTSLHMIDANNGWAVNENSILRTNDGGITWGDATPAGFNGAGSNYFFLDGMKAWVLAAGSDPTSGGTLFRTTNAGSSWTSIPIPFGGGSISFSDANTGWAMVGLGAGMSHMAVAIYRSSDGGNTWSLVFTDDPNATGTSDTLPFAGDKNGLTAHDTIHGWVTGSEPVGNYIYVFSSQDGGYTWMEQNPALPPGYADAMTNAFPPLFFSSTEGVLPVGVYSNTSVTVLYLSHDGGQTWNPTQPVPITGQFSIPTKMDFFVWDGSKVLYASHDGGASWATITTNVDPALDLVSFQFVDPLTGWAVTSDANSHHQLYKTTDGGATWKVLIP
jgi:photosystem II stability/assembly factor-like uncharacterized protein